MATSKQIGATVVMLTTTTAKSATMILSPREVIRVTRQGPILRRARRTTFLVTIGEPNHDAAEFIARCKRAGEPFPVRKIRLQGDGTRKRSAKLRARKSKR